MSHFSQYTTQSTLPFTYFFHCSYLHILDLGYVLDHPETSCRQIHSAGGKLRYFSSSALMGKTANHKGLLKQGRNSLLCKVLQKALLGIYSAETSSCLG